MPQLVGSWLCSTGTVSLVGSGGLAMASNENSFFFFSFLNLTHWAVTLGLEDVYFCSLCNFVPE